MANRMAERTGQDPHQLRAATEMEYEYTSLLRRRQVEPREPIVAKKQPPGVLAVEGKNEIPLTTNIHTVKLEQVPVYLYDVTMTGVMRRPGGDRTFELTKKTKEDVLALQRKDKAREVFKRILDQEEQFFISKTAVFYDLQSLFYSMNALQMDHNGRKQLILKGNRIPAEWRLDYIRIELAETTSDLFPMDMSNLGCCFETDLGEKDTTLKTFLEIATSQFALMHPENHLCMPNGKNYLMAPEDHGFTEAELPMLAHDVYLGVGAHKGVRFVEGSDPREKASVGLLIETKKTPFYSTDPVITIAQQIVPNLDRLNKEDINKLTLRFKGLFVNTTHTEMTHKVKKVASESARTHTFMNADAESVSVMEYFKAKYNIALQHPDFPLVQLEGRRRGETIDLPMELLAMADNQTLDTRHQSPAMLQLMIKSCAVPPAVRREHNRRNFEALRLRDPNLRDNGIDVSERPMQITGRVLPAPPLSYENKNVMPDPAKNNKWETRGTKYFLPAKLSNWGVIYITGGPADRCGPREVEAFVQKFIQAGRERGMQIDEPTHKPPPVRSDLEQFEEAMRVVRSKGLFFCLFIHTDQDLKCHETMKRCEAEYQVITQDVRVKNVLAVVTQGKPQTMENIINKTNIKCGGLNYNLNVTDPKAKYILGDEFLYIGFGMEHAVSGRPMSADDSNSGEGPPSVIGFAANTNRNAFEFVGDFKFQEARRDEKPHTLIAIIDGCIMKFKKNRNHLPKRVIIYRNGCSEGQFTNIIKYEVPLIYSALEAHECDAKLTLIVPNKQQDVRLFQQTINPNDKPPAQNIKPGTIVDTQIVHPAVREFFLASHSALQGTTRTPRYTVLVDDNGLDNNKLQMMTYWLCYGHQIVNMPTSLPSPVYIALQYAKRGRQIYNSHINKSSSSSGSGSYTAGSTSNDSGSGLGRDEATKRLEYLSQYYCHSNGLLADKRTNA